MLKNLLLIIIVFSGLNANAEVKMMSFYFETSSAVMDENSCENIQQLILIGNLSEFQIIEINAYSNDDIGRKNKQLSQQRADTVLSFFGLNKEDVNLNYFGKRREQVNFTPRNWNRVDIYYFLGEVIEQIKVSPRPEVSTKEEVEISVQDIEKKVKKEVIVENIPILLPIKFEGGTSTILSSSNIYIEELFQLLKTNKQYNAEIQGHVCCENNRRMSKKRAKVVYNYLIDKGISKERLSFEGFSNLKPVIFPERSEKDRAKNRRVEVVFSKRKLEL